MESSFKSRDGLDFFQKAWPAEGQARGSVVIIHGYGEHCLRYEHVARAFNLIRLNVYSYDQRGHGSSPGKMGFIASFDQLLLDLDAYLEQLWPTISRGPVVLLGHSMGGLVLARHRQTRTHIPVKGLVFSSPFLALPPDVSPLLLKVANVLSKLTPNLPVRKLDPKLISQDPDVVKAYANDPKVHHGPIVARTGAEINNAVIAAQESFAKIADPLYVFHGRADKLAPPKASELLHKGAASQDKTIKLYDDGYHELFNEPAKEMVIAGVCKWVQKHLPTT